MRRNPTLLNIAALYEFVDPNFLNNKRPAVPGGAWPLESLRQKSLADLQQIWLTLLKERNTLATIKLHYLRHQEELGALPAPSRLTMIETSMKNIKKVVKERDQEATDKAVEIFKKRLQQGVYRYPPGPPPPPSAHRQTSTVKLILSKRVDPERLRELLGRYDVFEPHRGIVGVTLQLPEAVLEQKRLAEQQWTLYQQEKSDVEEYTKFAESASLYDLSAAELTPGVFAEETTAATIPVPPPMEAPPPPTNPLDRIRQQRKSSLSKSVIQLGYFPNITVSPPAFKTVADIPRPVHPDEIEGTLGGVYSVRSARRTDVCAVPTVNSN
ncbi:hypothetical protein AGDE_11251 [Angomonas deanei]|nr:hypothetical protein AGDE_11251 [Angomonas deanei]|eukprot:EPY26510.1 hypothetical protein AGDE_11251 [Angomonas deanei]